MEIRLKTLTPLWTGGADGGCDRLHETGITGSLRWWCESIVRGLGLYACDPSTLTCVYDGKRSLASICLVCQLFGCTGYGRRFRLLVEGNGDAGKPIEVKIKNPGSPTHRGWRIPPRVAGPLTLSFRPMRPGALDDFESAALYNILRFIERYGALGAKASHGQGVVRITDWGSLAAVMAIDAWIDAARARPAKVASNPRPAPNSSDFIGAIMTLAEASTSQPDWWKAIPLTGLERFSFDANPSWIASAPAVRAQLRGWLRNSANFPSFNGNLRNERHRLMGTIQTPVGPKGSDIFVTHLHKDGERWVMRIFAFVPCDGVAVDQAVRQLLADQAMLGPKVSSALGAIDVRVDLYPTTVSALLGSKRGSRE